MIKGNAFDFRSEDNRGANETLFKIDNAHEGFGFKSVKQVLMTTNNKNTIRGLHRQDNPIMQKWLKPVNGKFNLRIVCPFDLPDRFKKRLITTQPDFYKQAKKGLVLYYNNVNSTDGRVFFVPAGWLLGYLALEDNSKMLYIDDGDYNKETDRSFNAFDDGFNIDWGISKDNAIMNLRDKTTKNYPEI